MTVLKKESLPKGSKLEKCERKGESNPKLKMSVSITLEIFRVKTTFGTLWVCNNIPKSTKQPK